MALPAPRTHMHAIMVKAISEVACRCSRAGGDPTEVLRKSAMDQVTTSKSPTPCICIRVRTQDTQMQLFEQVLAGLTHRFTADASTAKGGVWRD